VVRVADLSAPIGAQETFAPEKSRQGVILAGGGKMANNVACKYRVTATIKADTIYELETIKANLIKAGAKILRIDPIMMVAEKPPDPPKHAA
jgi:hypothetical protein